MKFSCKISNSLFHYLERSGVELSEVYEQLPMPIELLKDPSYWISAHDMEQILSVVEKSTQYQRSLENQHENLFQSIAHLSAELKCWGVLDHVLRMMPRPFEIFRQPDNLLSHFIQPRPPVLNLNVTENKVEFDLPILHEDFPHVVEYLRSAIEAIPTYKGHSPAHCKWDGIHLEILYEQNQIGLSNFETENQLSPDLFRSVIYEIEKRQPELAEIGFAEGKQELFAEGKHESFAESKPESKVGKVREEIPAFKSKRHLGQQSFFQEEFYNSAHDTGLETSDQFVENQKGSGIEQLSKEDLRKLGQNLAKLNDYMYRAQQMVTILSQTPMNKNTSQKLFHKADWQSVRNQFPEILQESFKLLKHMDSEGDQSWQK